MKQETNLASGGSAFKRLDWVTTILPFVGVTVLCLFFMADPVGSASILGTIRFFLGDQMSTYYLLIGLGALICSFYMAFSRFGKIRLGDLDQP